MTSMKYLVSSIKNLGKRTLEIRNSMRSIAGQSLFEVVIAIGLVAVVLVAVLSLSTTSIRNSNFSRNNVVATKYVQEATEWIRNERDSGWDTFIGYISDDTSMCIGGLVWGGSCDIGTTIFDRQASFTCKFYDANGGPPPPTLPRDCDTAPANEINLIDVEVKVIWEDSQGTHEVKSLSNLTRWR